MAAVDKIEEKRKPDDFIGYRNRKRHSNPPLLRCPAEISPVKAGSFLADRSNSLCSLALLLAALASLPKPVLSSISCRDKKWTNIPVIYRIPTPEGIATPVCAPVRNDR